MAAFLLWLILLVVCWPLALLALLLYPLIWLLLLPFRILGFVVEGRVRAREGPVPAAGADPRGDKVAGGFQADRYWSLNCPPRADGGGA